ncbi:hypothetical protein [Nocardioides sp.]|uniref:hypothetical protein n=1 Tax=Nocardioides sp. TaxID=35761 RepID=UPI003D13E438
MSEPIEPTGDPDVDAVLETMADLEELPVEDHIAVFEQAHERLRAALEAPGRVSDSQAPAGVNPIPPGLRPGG